MEEDKLLDTLGLITINISKSADNQRDLVDSIKLMADRIFHLEADIEALLSILQIQRMKLRGGDSIGKDY